MDTAVIVIATRKPLKEIKDIFLEGIRLTKLTYVAWLAEERKTNDHKKTYIALIVLINQSLLKGIRFIIQTGICTIAFIIAANLAAIDACLEIKNRASELEKNAIITT